MAEVLLSLCLGSVGVRKTSSININNNRKYNMTKLVDVNSGKTAVNGDDWLKELLLEKAKETDVDQYNEWKQDESKLDAVIVEAEARLKVEAKEVFEITVKRMSTGETETTEVISEDVIADDNYIGDSIYKMQHPEAWEMLYKKTAQE